MLKGDWKYLKLKSKYRLVKLLVKNVSDFCIYYSVINSFVIKNRKKEISLYHILGMEKRNIRSMMFLETLIIALISLSSGLLSAQGKLTPDQRESLRDNMNKFMGSKNAGKMMVLENGMQYHGITMNPEAAQMLETRTFEIEEICRWFRVPPFMVGHLDKQSSWASSVEGMNMQFLTNTLRPLLVNIEQEISRCLIGAAEFETYYVEFGVEGLLRADSKGRAEYYASALNNGWYNRNEVRRKENEAPIAGGEIYTIQSALIPLDQVGTNYKGDNNEQTKPAASR